MKFKVLWSENAKNDLKKIYSVGSNAKFDSIYKAPSQIVFPEQYQIDEYRMDCRRIIVGNYKILYQNEGDEIRIIKIFNSLHNPINS